MGEDGKTKETEDIKNKDNVAGKTKDDETQGKENNKPDIDEEGLKNQGVSEYLKKLGVNGDDLESIINKHKEEEEKNSTELQKVQKELKKALKMLHEERESNQRAQAQLEALKLGADPDLVEDLIIVAMSKVTEGKDIKKVISEIKEGNTGKIYFGENKKEDEGTGRTVTRVTDRKTKKENDNDKNRKIGTGGFADGILNNMKQSRSKKSFWD